jgi:nucleotide-binding universal stress UspA family protein
LGRQAGRLVLVTTRWDSDTTGPREYLDDVARSIIDVKVEPIVDYDRTAEEAIHLVAEDAPGRIVCMTTHGRGRFRWAVLGSVAERVIHDTRDTTLLIGRHSVTEWPTGRGRVLIAVDGSSASPGVLVPAVEWAKALDLDVVVVAAVHPLDREFPDAVIDTIGEHVQDQGLRVHREILRSSYPAGALADVADEHGADLIAMSSHARTGGCPSCARERDDGRRGPRPLSRPRSQGSVTAARRDQVPCLYAGLVRTLPSWSLQAGSASTQFMTPPKFGCASTESVVG